MRKSVATYLLLFAYVLFHFYLFALFITFVYLLAYFSVFSEANARCVRSMRHNYRAERVKGSGR